MFESNFTRNLKEGEELIEIVRRFYISYLWQALVALIFILLPFFLIFPLFRWGWPGIIMFFTLLIFGIIFGIRQTLIYFLNALVITDQRIIDFDQRGLFNRVVSEATYEKIQDVSFSIKGVWQTLYHYGDLQIQTAGNHITLEICDIANPQRVQDRIVDLQSQVPEPAAENLSAAELLDMVTKIKKGIGEDTFNRLAHTGRSTPKRS
ncbi:MAG: PH domain-containing protein [Patescibacteria group bacterium]|jgi:uncharacterized membrane protein YdbT with pleckstrin-like domain